MFWLGLFSNRFQYFCHRRPSQHSSFLYFDDFQGFKWSGSNHPSVVLHRTAFWSWKMCSWRVATKLECWSLSRYRELKLTLSVKTQMFPISVGFYGKSNKKETERRNILLNFSCALYFHYTDSCTFIRCFFLVVGT